MKPKRSEPLFPGSVFIKENAANGFAIHFAMQDDGSFVGQHTFTESQQGPPMIAHGGALAAVLDEAMGYIGFEAADGPVLTVNLNVSYRAAVFVGEAVMIRSEFDRREGRKIFARATIHKTDGTLAVQAEAIFIAVSPKR